MDDSCDLSDAVATEVHVGTLLGRTEENEDIKPSLAMDSVYWGSKTQRENLIHVCMYVRTYVRMSVRTYVCLYVCVMCMYVYVYVCVCVCCMYVVSML